MLTLAEAQTNFVETINDGPDRLDPALFAGPVDRVLLGLKAHANTISHARLVALEETFPLTREELGTEAFNRLSRDYCEMPEARAYAANHIGKRFPDFLANRSTGADISDLAAIEWAWLESYNAADADALNAADLAGLDEAALLNLPIAQHPSARTVAVHAPLASAMGELAGQQLTAILTVRPEADVCLVPLDPLQSELFARAAQENFTLGNLLAIALEQADEQAPLEPILHLVGAGALIKSG
jgi:hypothetical protein